MTVRLDYRAGHKDDRPAPVRLALAGAAASAVSMVLFLRLCFKGEYWGSDLYAVFCLFAATGMLLGGLAVARGRRLTARCRAAGYFGFLGGMGTFMVYVAAGLLRHG